MIEGQKSTVTARAVTKSATKPKSHSQQSKEVSIFGTPCPLSHLQEALGRPGLCVLMPAGWTGRQETPCL